MGFGAAVRTCLSGYADFTGRAPRSEYWWFWLFTTLVVGIPSAIGAMLMVAGIAPNGDASWMETGEGGPGAAFWIGLAVLVLAVVVSLALLVPNYAVGCRRLHDRGISGWLQLIGLIPLGGIVLLVLFLLPGHPEGNAYGSVPTPGAP